MDHNSKEFYIEISSETPMNVFTRSTLLKMLDVAEKEGAQAVYAAFRRGTKDIEKYVKTFRFVGFEVLSAEEMKEVSMT